MSNSFTYQVLRDTTEKAFIKLTANFDGSGQENNAYRIQANTLYGALDANNQLLYTSASLSNTAKPYYGLSIARIGYNIASQQKVMLKYIGRMVPIQHKVHQFLIWICVENIVKMKVL